MRAPIFFIFLVPAMLAGATSAPAGPSPDLAHHLADEPSADHRALERQIDDAVCDDHERAGTWNIAWAATFVLAAAGSTTYAALAPRNWINSDQRAGFYVTAAKATIGAFVKIVEPLEINVKGLCTDRHPASGSKGRHALLLEAAHRERRALIPNIFGGLALNTVGLLYLGYSRGAWESAWISFGIGSAVGVASTLTAPIHAWLLNRRLDDTHHIAAVPMISRQGTGIALTATW